MKDIDNWSIVKIGAQTMIGMLVGRTLSPCYDLTLQMMFDQQPGSNRGNIVVQRAAWPCMTFASLKSLDIGEGAIILPVIELSGPERASLAEAVERCEIWIKSMRAAESGLVIAGPDHVPPPIPIRRH